MSFHVTKKFVCTENYPIVDTPKGKLHGYQDNDIFCFHGIDYAHAERFHEAVPTPAWKGVKRAHDYGCGCPEMTYSREGKKNPFELILPQRVWNMSEDVLNLNVWTRSLNPKAKKPVMVWFHGGGFAAGSATHLYSYEGYAMAELYDVVVVSVNHRLNMLGFLDLSEFGEPYRHSANHGVMDLVEALKWVRDNIACFGGDPENVTIYGQSGGGGKVCTLLEMPSADGLYHRAIVQSGVMRGGPRNPNGKEIGRRTVELLGLNAETIGEIKHVEYSRLAGAVLQAFEELGYGNGGMLPWSPTPDGEVFLCNPLDVGFRAETRDIPIMAGSVVTEFVPSPIGDKSKWSEEKKLSVLRERFGEDTEAVAEAYKKAYPEVDVSYAASADLHARPAVIDFLTQKVKQGGAPAYGYIMTFEQPYLGGIMLGHNTDLHFMFHNAMNVEGMVKEGVTERLQDEMAGAWAAFARTGDPDHEKLMEHWRPFTEAGHETYAFGDRSMLKVNHDAELMRFCERYGGAPRAQRKKKDRHGILFTEEK